MARKIGAGFRVILQEDLAAQLQALATENGITEVLTDREALTAKGFETIRRNLGQGILQDGPELSAFLRALEKEKTEDEQACLEKAKGDLIVRNGIVQDNGDPVVLVHMVGGEYARLPPQGAGLQRIHLHIGSSITKFCESDSDSNFVLRERFSETTASYSD